MDDDSAARSRLLDAAEGLFYARGVQAVGMDEIRTTSGVPLKRLYRLYPGKDQLVEAFLQRRDGVWRGRLAQFVALRATPPERLLAVFDWLEEWFGEDGFRGCAWINVYGELGAQSPGVVARTREHKSALKDFLVALVAEADLPPALADQLYLLVEGATVTAGIFTVSSPAAVARTAASALISVAGAART